MEYINLIISNWQVIGTGLLAIVGGASVLAKLTPTQTDDNIIAAIGRFFAAVGLNTDKHDV